MRRPDGISIRPGELFMDSAGIVDDLIREVAPQGIFSYTDLIQAARDRKFHGVAMSSGRNRKAYLLFLEGEPEGALIADSKGELYGNKAVYLLRGEDQFTIYPLAPGVVERLIFGCRIYDKSHFTPSFSLGLPEIGKKAEGIGRLIITVRNEGVPAAGITVKIRRNGQIVANDISGPAGEVSFRLLYGSYELLIVRNENDIDVYDFSFSPDLQEKPLDLDIG
ncbi:MAG: hypothetical protein GKC05_02535 [Methanomicrobiales archaeon]|nr:hypothetical protein [Methanomicrobiales archaeon]